MKWQVGEELKARKYGNMLIIETGEMPKHYAIPCKYCGRDTTSKIEVCLDCQRKKIGLNHGGRRSISSWSRYKKSRG